MNQKRFKELLEYREGKLFWRVDRTGKALAGSEAGRVDSRGYSQISVDGVRYATHPLVWCMFHGEMPKHEIDHINRNKLDNRIENLRDVPRSLNVKNKSRYKNNSSGHPGVRKECGAWRTYLSNKYLGTYEHMRHAALARRFHEKFHNYRDAA